MVARDPITNDARERTRATIVALLDELAPELEAQAWARLTTKLVAAGLMPQAEPDAARRWLSESLGLSVHFSITADAASTELADASSDSATPGPADSQAPSAPVRPRETPAASQSLLDPANADAPRTDNPLAMAIVNFKGLRGTPEQRLQSPPIRSLERHWRESSKKKSRSDAEASGTDESGSGKRHDAAPGNKKPRRWPWG